MADLKIVADYSDIQVMRRELVGVAKDAKASASVFETAYKKVEAQQKRSLNAVKQQLAFSKRMEAQKTREAKVAAAAAAEVAKEEERLKNKFVEGYTAMNIYTKEMNDLAVARKKDIITADEQKAAVASLNAQMKAGTGAFANAATGMQIVGKRANRTGVLAQQAGYQFGDFAVQVQSGTNPMIAFGQQATQLIGTFSMLARSTKAIMAFSALGVIVPVITAIAGAFMRTRDAAKEAEGGIKTLEEQIKSAKEATIGFKDEIERLNLGLEDANEQALYRGVKEAVEGVLEAERALEKAQKQRGDRAGTLVVLAKAELESAKELADAREKSLADYRQSRVEAEKKVTDAKEAASMADAERMLGEQMADRARQEALEIFNADLAATANTLDSVFKSRTLFYSIRFAGEETVMGQSLTPSPMKPKQSYEELLAMGVSPDALLGMGLKPKKARTGGGGGSKKSPAEELQEYLDKLQQQADLESQLVGLFGEKRNTEEEVIKARQKYGKVFTASQEAELRGTLALIAADKERQRVFEEAEQQRQQLVSSIESTLEDGFMSMIDGTKSVKDAFRDMARDIIRELYRVLVVKKLVASVSSFFGFADGGAFSGGSQIKAYADGGVVGGPTFFPMSGGKTGLMGEAGPEAIMPLKRGANGKLGVQAEGASQGNVVVNQSFNFQANGDDSVKKLIAQAAPQIANMTQKQIMDSRRRGGSMKAAFG